MNDPVAFAGSRFELLPIQDGDVAALVGNNSHIAKIFGRNRDLGAGRAEGKRKGFVGHRKLISPYSVKNHQQAAGQPLLDAVQAVADRGLRNLEQEIAEVIQHVKL